MEYSEGVAVEGSLELYNSVWLSKNLFDMFLSVWHKYWRSDGILQKITDLRVSQHMFIRWAYNVQGREGMAAPLRGTITLLCPLAAAAAAEHWAITRAPTLPGTPSCCVVLYAFLG